MTVMARDVARRAGVSVSTVSRALAGSPTVSEATRRRVAEIADSLGYVAKAARGDVRTGPGVVGLVIPDISDPYFVRIARAVRGRARQHGRVLLLADFDDRGAREQRVTERFARCVDALMLCSPRADLAELQELAARLPVVVLGREVEGVCSVVADDAPAIVEIVEHLRALGHRRIGYVGGSNTSRSDLIRSTAALGCAGDGLSVELLGKVRAGVIGGRSAVDMVRAAGVTAVLCINDLVAAGLVAGLRDAGLSVPGDVSVVGYDDSGYAQSVWPALTTVAVPATRMAEVSVDLLIERALGGRVASPPAVAASVVLRRSTGPAPAA